MLKENLGDLEKEICHEIREQLPEAWGDKDNFFIYNFCTAVTDIELLIYNRGYKVKDAVLKVINNL